MFEFGRDLRRLFEKARDSYDLGWLELVTVGLVETEARHQSTDAGRVSCPQPFDAWMRAAALWREHGRRTGMTDSLHRAEQAGRDAAQAAQNDDQAMRAALDVGHTSLLVYDLYGSPRRLTGLISSLERLPTARRAENAAEVVALKARLQARQARLSSDPQKMVDAAYDLTQAMSRLPTENNASTEELQLDRAALSLEAGLLTRNARLLDQAGRDLRKLVEGALPEERPVSRARALALCGTGMAALAAIAGNSAARTQAHALFDAAAEQFTADHSPLDWASIQLLRAERGPHDAMALSEACAMTDMAGLILGAMLRERRYAFLVAQAEKLGDIASLNAMRQELVQLLASPMDEARAIDWASNQISMTRIALALNQGHPEQNLDMGMALYEAADAANIVGAPSLAQRARDLIVLTRAT